ncbi:MAG TPA: DUF3135 domain-containing protein [Rhodocyclaceae bacterium]
MDFDFYFNEWAFLARTDPALFESRRREMIAAFLDQSGVRRERLEALQSKIDQQRELAATPERAVVAISELMCRSLEQLSSEMTDLVAGLRQLKASPLVQAMAEAEARKQKIAA